MVNKKDYEKIKSDNTFGLQSKCSIRSCDNHARYVYSLQALNDEVSFSETGRVDIKIKKLFLCDSHYKDFKLCEYCFNLLDDDYGNSSYYLVEGKTLKICDHCNELELHLRISRNRKNHEQS